MRSNALRPCVYCGQPRTDAHCRTCDHARAEARQSFGIGMIIGLVVGILITLAVMEVLS